MLNSDKNLPGKIFDAGKGWRNLMWSDEYFRFNYETHLVSRRGNYPAAVSPRPGRWGETWAECPGWRWSSPRRSERPLPACRPTDETARLGNHASILKGATLTRSTRAVLSLFPVRDSTTRYFYPTFYLVLHHSIKIYGLFTPFARWSRLKPCFVQLHCLMYFMRMYLHVRSIQRVSVQNNSDISWQEYFDISFNAYNIF